MRTVVVADIHSNLGAFEAVLADARSRGDIDSLWCLGDLVGYGPQPSECIALLRSMPNLTIAGNHDLAASGLIGLDHFNPLAAQSACWTMEQLSAAEAAWMRALPRTTSEGEYTLVHGTLWDPVWQYLVDIPVASQHLQLQRTPYCFVGHSHLPLIYVDDRGRMRGRTLKDGDTQALGEYRFVANAGSVGQPRDGDPRAAYGIVDTDAGRVSFHRVEYDIAATQALMHEAGLPPYLAERLAYGH